MSEIKEIKQSQSGKQNEIGDKDKKQNAISNKSSFPTQEQKKEAKVISTFKRELRAMRASFLAE